jgi:hypothetical protein
VPTRPPEEIDFRPDDRSVVLAAMDELARGVTGWINLRPAVDEEEPPPRSSLFGLLSACGPDVPLCTWVPGQPTQVGVQHAAGVRAAQALTSLQIAIPEGWRILQDHPRRGLVLVPPPETPNEAVLDWLLRAGDALSTLRLAGWWRAAVYRGG